MQKDTLIAAAKRYETCWLTKGGSDGGLILKATQCYIEMNQVHLYLAHFLPPELIYTIFEYAKYSDDQLKMNTNWQKCHTELRNVDASLQRHSIVITQNLRKLANCTLGQSVLSIVNGGETRPVCRHYKQWSYQEGDYIGHLSWADWIDQNKQVQLVSLLQSHPEYLVYGRHTCLPPDLIKKTARMIIEDRDMRTSLKNLSVAVQTPHLLGWHQFVKYYGRSSTLANTSRLFRLYRSDKARWDIVCKDLMGYKLL